MTYDFEAHEAASLLAAAYLRKGVTAHVAVDSQSRIWFTDPKGTVVIPARLALYSAKQFWSEILDQP